MSKWIKTPNTRYLVINGRPDYESLKRWSYEQKEMVDWHWKCDVCGWERCEMDLRYNYCPYCGDKKENADTKRMESYNHS